MQREKDNNRLMQTKWDKERQDLQRHSTHLEGEVSKRDQWLKKAKDIITECAPTPPHTRPLLPEHTLSDHPPASRGRYQKRTVAQASPSPGSGHGQTPQR